MSGEGFRREFPRELSAVFASYFANGAGPTTPMLQGAIGAAGIPERSASGSKSNRVTWAFADADNSERYALVEELLVLIRNDNGFSTSSDWVRRAKAAFAHAGATLDDDGYVEWGTVVKGTGEGVNPRVSGGRDPLAGARIVLQGTANAASRVLAGTSETGARATDGSPESSGPVSGSGERQASVSESRKTVFIVHGQDAPARHEVENWVMKNYDVDTVVLMDEPSKGRTVIEKFEDYADRSGFAIVLMTADDYGGLVGSQANPRARQNVVFEFGFFVGRLGRANVVALVEPEIEKPSDVAGVIYVPYAPGTEWKEQLRKELREASIPPK